MLGGSSEQHSGLRFAATAIVLFCMRTDFDVVDRQPQPEFSVHGTDDFPIRSSGRDVGLVRHDDDLEPRRFEFRHRLLHARKDAELLEPRRCDGPSLPQHVRADHPVAIEECGTYHLVAFLCSFGCETSACQTTAWNASTCGVTRASATVGMVTTTSPTALV